MNDPFTHSITVRFGNASGERSVIGYGNSRDEAISDAVERHTGQKILWAVAPNSQDVPSPAAPQLAADATGKTFEEQAPEDAEFGGEGEQPDPREGLTEEQREQFDFGAYTYESGEPRPEDPYGAQGYDHAKGRKPALPSAGVNNGDPDGNPAIDQAGGKSGLERTSDQTGIENQQQ